MEEPMVVRLVITATLVLMLATVASSAAPADTAVLDAARAANWSSVHSLVSKGLPRDTVNAMDADGSTALHWAVRADEIDIATLLIRSGADANVENCLGVTPLYLAAQNGNAA